MHGARFRVINGDGWLIGIGLVVFARLFLHLAAGVVSCKKEEKEERRGECCKPI